LLLPLVLLALAGCAACPPAWVESPPVEPGFLHASGSAGDVFVDADATHLALTRAARVLADALGLDVESRLSVVRADERLFVEAVGADGPTDALDALELVDLVECEHRVWVLVRLPRP
jgi:hypothetical protein